MRCASRRAEHGGPCFRKAEATAASAPQGRVMKSSRLLAVAFAFAVVPLTARAGLAQTEHAEGSERTEHAEPASHGKVRYPMKADEFRRLIEKKIALVKSTIDKKLERHGVSADRRAQIRHLVDGAATDLRAAVDRVTADGVVTKDEGVKVRALADRLRGKVREQMRNEKNAQKEGAGDKPRDGKKGAKKPGEKAAEKKNAAALDE